MRPLAHLFALSILLLPAAAGAQIEVKDQYDPHEPITATLANEIPPGAQIDGGWSVTDAQLIECHGDRQEAHIWAAPGEHVVRFDGVWLKTRSLTIDGEPVQVLEGFGFIREEATFQVGPPDPPPPPPGDRWGIIIEETSQRTPEWAALWQQVRDRFTLSRLLILDRDRLGAAEQLVQGALDRHERLPVLVVLSESGEVVDSLPCPPTLEGITEELTQ